MSRESGFQAEYGLMGAGAVSSGAIGKLPGKAQSLGPVAGVSFRVASRIANTLKAGHAARSADELNAVRTVLFHSPPDQAVTLFELLREAKIEWGGKSVLFCDYEAPGGAVRWLRDAGASVATLRPSGIFGRMLVEGHAPAITLAHRIAREGGVKAIEIEPGSALAFEAAATLGTVALTPLLDCAAALVRQCGIRDNEAVSIVVALFEQTAREYARSGRQSWEFYVRDPEAARLESVIDAVDAGIRDLFGELILLGFRRFEKHPETALKLSRPPDL